jgi:cation diffusion facilitator CzcD-associated flavoprotein CzcO
VRVRHTETGERETLAFDVLVSANGPLSRPLFPKVPGLESFEGTYFHNLRWDNNVQWEGKRVALVGNGSSGVQIAVSRCRHDVMAAGPQ